jgi:hypothetical protein
MKEVTEKENKRTAKKNETSEARKPRQYKGDA